MVTGKASSRYTRFSTSSARSFARVLNEPVMSRRRLDDRDLEHRLAVNRRRADLHVLFRTALERFYAALGIAGVVGKEIDNGVKIEALYG